MYELQEIDLEVDTIAAQIRSIDQAAGETDELRKARDRQEEVQGIVHSLENDRKELDAQAASLREQRRQKEQKLYSGKVTNIREIQDLEKDVAALKRQLEGLEDRELAIMSTLEETEPLLKEAAGNLQATTDQWKEDQEEMAALRAKQVARLGVLREKRQKAVSRVNAEDMPEYSRIRALRAGRVVAKIERGMCGGCRISLTSLEQQRARNTIVKCSSCGRILMAA